MLKKLFFVLFLSCHFGVFAQISFVPIQVNGLEYEGNPFVFANKLYLQYEDKLVEYDGNNSFLIAPPAECKYRGRYFICNEQLYLLFYNNLNHKNEIMNLTPEGLHTIAHPEIDFQYFHIASVNDASFYLKYYPEDNSQERSSLAVGNQHSISLLDMPDGAEFKMYGNSSKFVEYKNETLMPLTNSSGKIILATLKDNLISLVDNPEEIELTEFQPTVFNDDLYFRCNNSDGRASLAKYDGNQITLIPNPDTGYGVLGNYKSLVNFHSKLYLIYQSETNKINLTVYHNNRFQFISSPEGKVPSYILCSLDNELIVKFRDSSLGKFKDGKLETIPCEEEYYHSRDSIHLSDVYFNEKLYFSSNGHLAEYNGVNIKVIPKIDAGRGYIGGRLYYGGDAAIVFNHDLYLSYLTEEGKSQLTIFNEGKLNLIEKPEAGEYKGNPVIYNGELYIKFNNKLAKVTKPTLPTSTKTIKNKNNFTILSQHQELTVVFSEVQKSEISFYQLSGKLLKRVNCHADRYSTQIDHGIYLIQIKSGLSTETIKVFIP